MIHTSFLSHDRFKFLWVALALGLISALFYLFHDPKEPPNGGTWLGKRRFSKSIVNQFTKRQNLPPESDRAIGFDTPSTGGKSSAGDLFSDYSFGHLGFTGTSVWADMERNIVIVLLTNRVHPTREKQGIYSVRREFHTKVIEILLKKV